jgi:hypothetical protein
VETQEEDRFRTSWGALKEPKRSFLGLAIALFAGGAILALRGQGDPLSIGVLVVVSVLFGWLVLRDALYATKGASFRNGTIAVRADGTLCFGKQVLAARGELVQGFVVPTEDGTLVRLERHLPPALILRVRDEDEGTQLLGALGFDAAHVAAEMQVASAILGMSRGRRAALTAGPVGLFLAVCTALSPTVEVRPGGATPSAVVAALGALMVYLLVLFLTRTSVRIGRDGVLLRWLGWSRFVRISEIDSVSVYEDTAGGKSRAGVRLVLHGGGVMTIATGPSEVGVLESKRLCRRIEEARSARDAGGPMQEALAHGSLDLGRKNVVEWVRELRRLGSGAASHRTAAVPVDVLCRIVEDTAAPATVRAGAAVAAAASDAPEIRQRIRIAAETTAEPALRASLARIADTEATAEDDAVAAAIDELRAERVEIEDGVASRSRARE